MIGRVRAREALLFDVNRYEQLIAAENEENFLRVLANSPYGEFQRPNAQEILNEAWWENFWFLKKYCFDQPVLFLFQYREDLHNLKLLIKAQITKARAPESFISPFGIIPLSVLNEISQAFSEKDSGQLNQIKIPEVFKKGIVQAKIAYDSTNEPKLLDCALDKAVMTNLLAFAQINQFLYTYFQKRIDLENIRTFLRIRFFQEKESLFAAAFIPGGTIKLTFFSEIFSDLMEMVIERFALSPYGLLIVDGINYLLNNKSFVRLERLATEHLLTYLRRARFFTFGFEPLISYFLFKENEINNLRKILQGLRQKVERTLIRENIAYA